MKVKIFTRALVLVLVLAIVLPILATTVFAKPQSQKRRWKKEEIELVIDYVKNEIVESSKKEALESSAATIDVVKENLPGLIDAFGDMFNGEGFDTHSFLDSIIGTGIDVCASIGTAIPVVAVIGSAVNLVYGVIVAILGGEAPDSEISQMEARLNETLTEIQDTIYSLEDKVDELSEQVNESTNRIINELTTAMDSIDAKRYVRTFMLGVDGNFGYNQYRNYLFGTTKGSPMAGTAYYSMLVAAMKEKASNKEIKLHYDRLYEAIIENENYFYSYVVGTGNGMGKSIVQYYYDVLSARPELIENEGSNAEIEAILFAYDLYSTEIWADQLKIMCNSYQYVQMLSNAQDIYYYGNDVNDFVTRAEIEGNDSVDSINMQIEQRVESITAQFARDIVYILGLSDVYLVEGEGGNIYEVIDNGEEGFGNVLEGQIVYLSLIPEEICSKFDINATDFDYEITEKEIKDGVFEVGDNFDSAVAQLKYKGDVIETITFKNSKSTASGFDGGSGIASDPYLISRADQFAAINDGLDKHYRLTKDIDFENEELCALGFSVNPNGTEVYGEFTGSLDGNGYTLKNLNVVGTEISGVFGVLGEGAVVKNIKFENVVVDATVAKAKKSNSQFFAGVIAGKSSGEIKNVEILSCSVSLTVNNKKLEGENRCISAMAGGVVGINQGKIASCVVGGVKISADATHDFGGNSVEANTLSVYAGGICGVNLGFINASVVKEDVEIAAKAKSIYNHNSTVDPYVTALVGGITAEVYDEEYLANIKKVVCRTKKLSVDAILDCQSNWGEFYRNYKKEKQEYVPGYDDNQLKIIKGKDTDVENVGVSQSVYVVDYTYGEKNSGGEYVNSIYKPGSIKTVEFKLEKSEEGNNGVIIKYYTYDDYTLILASDGAGTFVSIDSELDFRYEIKNGVVEFKENNLDRYNVISLEINGEASVKAHLNNVFVTDDLKLVVNGKECEYEVIDVYGFNTNNEKFSDVKDTVVVLFKAFLDEGEVYLTKEIPIRIEENYVIEKTIIGLKESYLPDEFSPIGLAVQYILAVGKPKSPVLDETAKVYGNLSQLGEVEIMISFGEDSIPCTIFIVCDHKNIFSAENKSSEKSTPATCHNVGKDAYVCPNCKYVEYVYRKQLDHNPDREYEVAPTCTAEGNTGKIVCTNEGCGKVLANGRSIPKLKHSYQYENANKHTCSACGYDEYHHYSVEESTRLLDDSCGAKAWYVVYTYTCTCVKDGRLYTDEAVDKNTSVNENMMLPSVVVSDGYVLNGGDEVVVYVQLVNNPGGIYGAAFGIRYSEGLELVGIENGNIFEGSLISSDGATNYGYNFVRAKGGEFVGDGNLLKLTFKVSKDAIVGETYDVSVAYEMRTTENGKAIGGGFSVAGKTEEQMFITKSGTIKVVAHLPGDVNCDGEVNLLDAMEIAKFMTTDGYELEEKYANVDLSSRTDGKSNIGINDIVTILQAISGGYRPELELRDQSFEIILNTGDPEQVLENIDVSVYGENNVYAVAGLTNLERTGYKFLGWYDQIFGGNRIDITDFVKYNANQRKQTLYAQWELNTIVFKPENDTSGTVMDTIYYGDGEIPVPQDVYGRKYEVLFVAEEKLGLESVNGVLEYALIGWNVENSSKVYDSLDEAIADLKDGYYGEIVLTPRWSEKPTLKFPEWQVFGYENEIKWYGDKEDPGTEIIPGAGNDTITQKCAVSNGKYKIYSKHSLITFMIEFKDGDKTVALKECSVEDKLALKTIEVEKTGQSLTWLYDDNLYDTNKVIGYISGVSMGETIQFTACWDVTLYKVGYAYNFENSDAVVGTGVDEEIKYSVGSLGGFDTLANVVHNNEKYGKYYRIIGWKLEGTNITFTTIDAVKTYFKNNPQNDAILVAKWLEPDKYTVFQSEASGEYVIFDWSRTRCEGNVVIKDVSEIYFIGAPGRSYAVNIILSYSNSEKTPVIHLVDFKTTGGIYRDENAAFMSVIVECDGENMLQGGAVGLSPYSDGVEPSPIKGFETATIKGVDKNATLHLVATCYSGKIAKIVEANDLIYEGNCSISYQVTAVKPTGGTAQNDYVFKAWLKDGRFLSGQLDGCVGTGSEGLSSKFSVQWYEPIRLSVAQIGDNDLMDISSTEYFKVTVSRGGSGQINWRWEYVDYDGTNNSRVGIFVSYDISTGELSVTKDENNPGKNGGLRLIIWDETTGQEASETFKWSTNGCFTGDTLIAMADGSCARIDSLKVGDIIMSWNAITGQLEPMPISLFWNHGDAVYDVIKLTFANGKTVKVVTAHGFFDSTLNKYVYIGSDNYADFVGHKFACLSESGAFEDIELVSGEHVKEYVSCYSLRTACNDNAIADGFLSLTLEDIDGFLTFFEFGENYMYDKEKMDADIAKYGLYTYEEWQEYGTYEEFVALNCQYLKIAVGKGYLTVDDIIELISGMRCIQN